MTQQLRTVELDFDANKAALKAFLSTRPEFSDYNFEGSGLTVLLNILSYNTHYAAMLANLQTADLYLDTGTKLSTVALNAKRLGYLPKSKRAATAVIDLEIFPGSSGPSTLTIGRDASFTSSTNGLSFDFVTTSAKTIAKDSSGRYVFRNIEIKEGSISTFRYLFSEQTPQNYVIPSQDVDIETLTVKIQQSTTNANTDTWTKSQSIADNTSTSKVFYVKMNRSGFYEIEFGDGVLSKALEDGNIIIMEYLECSGSVANGMSYFSFTDSVEGYSANSITVISNASGGSDMERLDSIKKNAQASVTTQNRAVSEGDYESSIWNIYPYEDISVWGGEKNNPPEYGRVFVCIKPSGGVDYLSETVKNYISAALSKTQSIVTSKVKFVDPDYVNLVVECDYYFTDTETTLTESSISMLVSEKIGDYASANINRFSSTFSSSRLGSEIEKVGDYITSVIIRLKLSKNIPILNASSMKTTYELGNPVRKSNSVEWNVSSGWFTLNGSSEKMYIDDSNGILRAYYNDNGIRKTFNSDIGTINYDTGEISLKALAITGAEDGENIRIDFVPSSNDIISYRSTITKLDTARLYVNGIVNSVDKSQHIFVTGR